MEHLPRRRRAGCYQGLCSACCNTAPIAARSICDRPSRAPQVELVLRKFPRPERDHEGDFHRMREGHALAEPFVTARELDREAARSQLADQGTRSVFFGGAHREHVNLFG